MDKDVLRELGRVGAVSGEAQRQREDARRIRSVERLEGGDVTALRACDQGLFAAAAVVAMASRRWWFRARRGP